LIASERIDIDMTTGRVRTREDTMNRSLTGTCLAAALGVALTASAQTPPPAQQPTTRPDPPAATASLDKEMKLTGCLKAGSTAGAFDLTNVKKDKPAGAGTSATPPASAQAPAQEAMASAAPKTVTLKPAAGVDLAAHLNHQIEVAGSWDASATAGAEGAAAKASKTFNVTSVKMIAASCTSGTN
jgi:hypothetical protein